MQKLWRYTRKIRGFSELHLLVPVHVQMRNLSNNCIIIQVLSLKLIVFCGIFNTL